MNNRKENTSRDPLSWAGSGVEAGRKVDRQLTQAIPKDAKKLHEMRNKLQDDSYVDGAVTRIANFLTSTLKKKGQNE
jgi:hypothetical protein